MRLEACKKIVSGRCERPEDTIARLQPALESRYPLRYRDESVAQNLFWSAVFVDALDFRGMGKGMSPVWSRAGALAESAEWLAALDTTGLKGFTTGHAEDIPGAMPLEMFLPHVTDLRPETLRRICNSACAQYWVDADSLIDGTTRKVPLEYLARISGPNGRAAGNRIEEAILHATLEIFERRAHITILRNRMIAPTFDSGTVAHPVLREQLEFYRQHGIEVVLKDLSFGGILPCVGAYFCDPNIPPEFQFHHFFKVGASFNREEALMRALTEFSQGRRADEFIDGCPTAQARVLNHDFRALQCIANDGDNFLSAFMFGFVPTSGAAYLRRGPRIPFTPIEASDDCREDILKARTLCETLGRDLLVVDQTDPDIGFPVVRVIVPGYSDVLPFHSRTSPILFRNVSRNDVLDSYPHGFIDPEVPGARADAHTCCSDGRINTAHGVSLQK